MLDKPRAIVVESQGAAPRLTTVERPKLTPGKLRIRVNACALNFADLLMIDGNYQNMPHFPLTPGLEISGSVIEICADDSRFSVGDSVIAFTGHGGLADEIVIDSARCLHRPQTMDDVTGAGFMIAYGTSHLALTRAARIRPGERLIVLGAGGGVGLTAVEIGAALKAEVTAVARGAGKLEAARERGATTLIDSDGLEDPLAAFRARGPADVVYDAIGGPVAEAAMRSLGPEGRHLLIGFASGDLPALKPNHMLVKNISAIGRLSLAR